VGFFSRLTIENRNVGGEEYIRQWLAGDNPAPETSAGIDVNEAVAISLTAVYACIRLISWTIASLPLFLYERKEDGKAKDFNNDLYSLMHDSPNPEQTSFMWRQLMSVHQNLWGAGISEIEFDSSGMPVALWPIPPWLVQPKRDEKIGAYYIVRNPKIGTERILFPHQILIFQMLTSSSYSWISPIAIHRETIGAAIAVKQFGAKTFGQGTNPAAVVYHPGKLDEPGEKSLRESFKGYAGLSKSHRLMLLNQGMKWERVGLPPEDAQYLETRRFDISEIARIYNVPLHMLHDHEKQTSFGKGIEEQNIGFVTFTINPNLVQWEQELNKKILLNDKQYFYEFNVNGLLRGKMLERYRAYAIGRQWGFISADDVRDRESENRLPNGEGQVYLNPMNMINAKFAEEYNPLNKDKDTDNDEE